MAELFNPDLLMLYQAVERLPQGVKVILLADRGFVHTKLMKTLTAKWGWHYRIRLKKDCWIWRKGKGCCQLQDFHFKPGEALCLHNVRLHKEQAYGAVQIIVGRNNINGEFWAIVSNEKTTLQTFREYGLRFDIEENFLDDQSNGWNIQKPGIRCACALSRLWFILAVATLYVTAQGVEVVETGKRRWVDTHWFRGNNYFRIGWEWVKFSIMNGWKLIRSVTFNGNDDPDPAMASRKQHKKRLYRLEFQVQTFCYSLSFRDDNVSLFLSQMSFRGFRLSANMSYPICNSTQFLALQSSILKNLGNFYIWFRGSERILVNAFSTLVIPKAP